MKPRKTSSALTLGGSAPLYRQVKDLLVRRIGQGEWRPGAALPSEPDLAADLGVSISTVRAAVAELVKAHVLVRRQGKGTYISPRNEQESVYRFFQVFPNQGDRPRPVSKVVHFARARATDDEARRLALPPGATSRGVFRIRNVLRMGPDAVQASDIVLPQSRFPELSRTALTEAAPTLYGAYQTLYGITVMQTEDRLTGVAMPAHVARLLGQRTGAPGIRIERLARSVDGAPVETRHIYVRTDRYHLFLRQGGLD